jgi:hypothetical protein
MILLLVVLTPLTVRHIPRNISKIRCRSSASERAQQRQRPVDFNLPIEDIIIKQKLLRPKSNQQSIVECLPPLRLHLSTIESYTDIMELADALLCWAEHRSSSYTITLIPNDDDDSAHINYMSVRSFRANKSSAEDDGMWILTVSGDCEIGTNFEPYSVVFKIPNKFDPDTFKFEVSGWVTMSVTTAQTV